MSERQDADEAREAAEPSRCKKSRISDNLLHRHRPILHDYVQSRLSGASPLNMLQQSERSLVVGPAVNQELPFGPIVDFATIPGCVPDLDISEVGQDGGPSSRTSCEESNVYEAIRAVMPVESNQDVLQPLSAQESFALQHQPCTLDLPIFFSNDVDGQQPEIPPSFVEVQQDCYIRPGFSSEVEISNSLPTLPMELDSHIRGHVFQPPGNDLLPNDLVPSASNADGWIPLPVPLECDGNNSEYSTVPQGSTPLYQDASITLQESLAAVLTFSQTENLSGKALERLLALMHLHLPKPNVFPKSMHNFFTHFNCEDLPVFVHYYCSVCLNECVSASDCCSKCKSTNISFFIHLPVEPQLQRKFLRSDFLGSLNYKNNREKKNENNIEDIFDCTVFKRVMENNPSLREKCLTLTWNTDGASPYNSSTYSLWPVYYVINELSPRDGRYKKENMILGGLWGGHKKPCPNIFLRPAYDEFKKLKNDGMNVTLPNGDSQNYKVVVVCGTCDSPAKALFFNMKCHSGYDSCPKCHVKGEKSARTEDVLVFPFEPIVPRTEQNYLQDVLKAVQTKEESNGIKGPTLLFNIVELMLESTAIDSMHAVYIGVLKQMLKLLFSDTNSKSKFSLHKHSDKVNKLLQSIRLPHFVQREILDVDKLAFWKGSLCRTFFFHIMLPVLRDIMPENYFNHLKLLILGVSLLNSSSVSSDDINIAEKLLSQFVIDFEDLYTIRNMSYNVHLLTHLAKSVSETGPLCLSNCFPFESLNGNLMSLIHGTKCADLEIIKNLNWLTELPIIVGKLPAGAAKDFCELLLHKEQRLKVNENITPGVFSVGKYSFPSNQQNIPEISGQNPVIFFRLFKHGLLYIAKDYSRGSRESCYVQGTFNNQPIYGKVHFFVKLRSCICLDVNCRCSAEFKAVTQLLDVRDTFAVNIPEIGQQYISHIKQYSTSDSFVLLNVANLVSVCYNVCVNNVSYICKPLNEFEFE